MDQKTINKVQSALDRGLTQKEAAAEANTSTRTVTRLIKDRLVQPSRRRRPALPEAKDTPGAEYRRMWSAADLQELFSTPAGIPAVQLLLETEARRGNWRMHEWIGRMRELPGVPAEWRSAIALLPIVARDIATPVLADLANLMREDIPWTTKELRTRYRRKATPIINQALTDIGKWVLNSDLFPPFRHVESGGPLKHEEVMDTLKSFYQHHQEGIAASNYEDIRYELLLELLRHLPEIDRPRHPLLQPRQSLLHPFGHNRTSMARTAAHWCKHVNDQ